MVLSFACKFCVLYFIFCSKYSIFDEDLSYLNIFFSSFIISKSKYLSPQKEIVDYWKTHPKQPHFYPIISYQIHKLSIQQHNILVFFKKIFDKNLSHLNTQNRFCLSFHLSISFLHERFHSWKLHSLQQREFIIFSFMVFTTEGFFEVAIESWSDYVGWIFSYL